MANFLNQFARSLNLQPTANILSQGILRNADLKRQKEEEEKRKKEQSNILQQLISGGNMRGGKVPSMSPEGIERPNEVGFQPHSPNLLGSLLSGAEPETLAKYKTWQGLTKQPDIPKIDIFTDAEGNKRRYILNKENNAYIPDMTPEGIISGKSKTKEEVIDATEIDAYKGWSGYKVQVEKDAEGNIVKYGQPHRRTREIQTDGGDKVNVLDKDYMKELKDRGTELADAFDILETVKQVGKMWHVDNRGNRYEIDKVTAQDQVKGATIRLKNYLDNFGSENTKTLINHYTGEARKQKQGDERATTWGYIYDDYISGDLSYDDFQELTFRFMAEYGFNPKTRFRR